MKYYAMAFALLFISQTVAFAQSPPPPTFVYKIRMGAGPDRGSMDYTMDVAIGSTAPDGTRKAIVTLHAPDIGAMKQASQAAQGPMVQMMINTMNVFANGIAKAPSLNRGATWHVSSNERQADVQYTVTEREQRNGGDTVVVAMKSSPSIARFGKRRKIRTVRLSTSR